MNRKLINNVNGIKKIRRPISVAQKLEIINKLDKGERPKNICATFNLSSSTVCSIYKQKDKLNLVAESCKGGSKLERITRTRDNLMEELERILTEWITTQENLNFLTIQGKALELFEDLKKADTDAAKDLEFKASPGWFERYKKRANLQHLCVSNANMNFPKELRRIVEEQGYSPKQIFNIGEIGLFWKRLPPQILIDDEYESNDQLLLLLGGNLEGDVKLKPLLVYHSQNPQALRGLNKSALPVIWRWNKKILINTTLFADYVTNYLSPFITSYCNQQNLGNKALLVMDGSLTYVNNVEDFADNIRVIFLPANNKSILQPIDQGIKDVFKAYYLLFSVKYLMLESCAENKPTIQQLWSDYNIKIAIGNIVSAWNKITQQNINSAWRILLSKYVYSSQDFHNVLEEVQQEIVKLVVEAGFELEHKDVQEVLTSYEQPNKIILVKQELEDNDEEEVMKSLDTEMLSTLFEACEGAIRIVEDNDPQMERSSMFKRQINDALTCYRELYETKKQVVSQMSSFCNSHPLEEVCASSSMEMTFSPTKVEADDSWSFEEV